MAKHTVEGRDDPQAGKKKAGERGSAGHSVGKAAEAAGGQHHAARAHGQPARVDTRLPKTREALLVLHADARRRRNAAALDSPEFRAAVIDIERIEIRVAAIERAQDPPLG
jgi:hypothetical protein